MPRKSRLSTLAIYAAIGFPVIAMLLMGLAKHLGAEATLLLYLLPAPALLALSLGVVALARIKRSKGKLDDERDCYFAITLSGIWLIGCWTIQLLGSDNR